MKNGIHRYFTGIALSVMLASTIALSSCRTTRTVHSAEVVQDNRLSQLDWNDHRTANLTLIDGKYYTPDGIKKCWCDECKKTARKFKTKYLSHDDVKVVTGYVHSKKPGRLVRIEPGKNDTRVTFVIEIYHDSNWLFQSAGTCLIDPATGDRYMIHDLEGGQELGRMNVVHGLKGQFVEQTMIFPPLKRGVKVIDFYEPDNYGDEALPDNGTKSPAECIYNIKIKNWLPRIQGEVIRL